MNLVWVHLFTKVDSLRWGELELLEPLGNQSTCEVFDGGYFLGTVWNNVGVMLPD